VKVSIVRGGGLAGIVTRTELTSEALPEDARRRLETLAAQVAPASGARPAHADELLYRVTIDGVTATHTESDLPDPVRALIEFVSERPERQDALGR
jgi:hypothetical protein